MSLIQRMDLSLENAAAVFKNYGFIMPADAEIIFEYLLESGYLPIFGKNKVNLASLIIVNNEELEKKLNLTYGELIELCNNWNYYLKLVEINNFNLNKIKEKDIRRSIVFLIEVMGKSIHKGTDDEKRYFAFLVNKIVKNSVNFNHFMFKTNEHICRFYLRNSNILQNLNPRNNKGK